MPQSKVQENSLYFLKQWNRFLPEVESGDSNISSSVGKAGGRWIIPGVFFLGCSVVRVDIGSTVEGLGTGVSSSAGSAR